jgi:quercetin dioxygenase-like cupin family protein
VCNKDLTPVDRLRQGAYLYAIMKTFIGSLCFLFCISCLAQSPTGKVLVLEKEQGEKRVRPARAGVATLPVEFVLKVTPQNSGSQHLILGTQTIPKGGTVPKHRHLGQDEVVFLQHGKARFTLNGTDYVVHDGGMIFAPVKTWMALENIGTDDIQLIFIYSAPGFEEYMRCTSAPAGEPPPQLSEDELRACGSKGDVEYEGLSGPARK